MKFQECYKNIVISFEYDVPVKGNLFYQIQDRIESELLKIKAITKVNTVMNYWFECDFDKKEEVKSFIASSIKRWTGEEIQKHINFLHESYSDSAEGYLIDEIQDLEKLKLQYRG